MNIDDVYNYILEVTNYMYDTGFSGEIQLLNDLNIVELEIICNKLKKECSTVDEYHSNIDDILTPTKHNAVYNRLAEKTYNRMHQIRVDYTTSPFNIALLDGLDDMYYNELMYRCRTFSLFFKMLLEEIENGNYNKNVLNKLKEISKTLEFIYSNNPFAVKSIHMPEYESEYYQRGLLDRDINRCISILSNYSNSDLAKEDNLAIATAIKVYLRSLFVILNNYEELAKYDNQRIINNDNLSNKMITDAFIANYEDLKNYNLGEGIIR